MTAVFHIISGFLCRVLASTALLLQLGLPMAQAQAASQGTDLASLLCNPSGRVISVEAKAALSELLAAVGEAVNDDEPTDRPNECERCVTANVAITGHSVSVAAPTSYARSQTRRPRAETVGPITARGPPCGSRAPPPFV
jgi:hypothetical protein